MAKFIFLHRQKEDSLDFIGAFSSVSQDHYHFMAMSRIIVFFLLGLISCNGSGQHKKTPKEFVSEVKVGKATYTKDSTVIAADLFQKMKMHEASFTNPEYYDSTILIVDTIIYDMSLNKIAIFVLAKNPTYRNPHSDSKLSYYYNAYCYLGELGLIPVYLN